MDNAERTRLIESNLSRMIDWIGKHDTKASFVLGIATAMLGVLASCFAKAPNAGVYAKALVVVATALLSAVFWFLFRGTFPDTSVARPSESPSLLFFGTVARMEPAEFRDRVKNLDTETHLQDLSHQCLEIAGIVAQKFESLRWAYRFLFMSLLPWAGSIMWLRFLSATPAGP